MGGAHDKKDLWMELTLVTDLDPATDSVMSEELFGPILPICAVNDISGAIELINSMDKPLSLYIFSQDKVPYAYA